MSQMGRLPIKICVAVHGYEPPGWAAETCRVVSTVLMPAVRIVAVLDVPCPPFTALIGPARRAYAAARALWQEQESGRLQGMLDALTGGLPGEPEVIRVPAGPGGLAHTITTEAAAWGADMLVVGPPASTPGSSFWPGAVHQHVLRQAAGTVVVTMPEASAPRVRRRPVGPKPELAEGRA